MDKKKYSITLADGTIIGDLRKNGNNYISEAPLTPELFDGNCSTVTFSDGETSEIRSNMELIKLEQESDGTYWFILRGIPAERLEKMKMRSDIEYLAMMTDVEL